MRRLISLVALFTALTASTATAASKYPGGCNTRACLERTCDAKCDKRVTKRKAAARRVAEWRRWSRMPIPRCTWLGESGVPRRGGGRGLQQFSDWRYSIRNGGSFGPPIEGKAHGKYQLMPSTYRAHAKYGDWSKLDQEIAAHRLHQAEGVAPWEACR